MKEKISIFKDLWKIPRYNALIKLGLYFLFFLVFGLIFSLNRVPTSNKKIDNQPIKQTNIYIYNINEKSIEYNLKKNTFLYDDITYEIENNEILCDTECDFTYLILFLPNKIEEYIKNGELLYKTEYKNGDIEYKYSISNSEVKDYFNSNLEFYIISKNNTYIIDLDNYNLPKINIEYK